MKNAFVLMGCLVAMACVRANELSPASVAAEIEQRGAIGAVEGLVARGDFERVLDHIEAGEGQWIALAPRLAPGTDAETAEDLGIALAYALPRNPEAVLPVIDLHDNPVIGVARVCGVPFIEGTIRDIHAYVKRAEAAVSGTGRPELAAVRRACLAALRR